MKINNIKQLIRETLEDLLIKKFGEDYYFELPPGIEGRNFFKDLTGIHDYDKVYLKKNNELPAKYENWEAQIEYMTMEEYYEECAKLQNSDIQTQINSLRKANVDKIAANMLNGTKYDMPYLDYVRGNQEGRHRVAAAARLGQEKIPVMLLDKSQKAYREEATNIEYRLGIWDDLVQMGNNYYCIFEGTDWKSIDQVLMRLQPNYDEYYLDKLLEMRMGKGSYQNINDFLKNGSDYYGNKFSQLKSFTEFAKAYAILKMNQNIIYDVIKLRNNSLLLKVLTDRIEEDYSDYSSCKEMLESIRYKYYYEYEYSIQSAEKDFEIPSYYIKEARDLFREIKNL